jgi:hypothetical protein
MADDPGAELVQAAAEGAVGAALEPVGELLGRLTDAPASEVGGYFQDWLRTRRVRRFAKTLAKTQDILDAAGVDPKAVPMGILWPLLEGASLEEDEDLADRWAALIANTAINTEDELPRYAGLLRELSPRDARLLDAVYEASYTDGEPAWFSRELDATAIGTELDPADLERTMDNLYRLRLCKPLTAMRFGGADNELTHMRLTRLGHDFVEACKPPPRRNSLD